MLTDEKIKKYTSMRMALWGNLLTSDVCGNNCLFCSNKHNPEAVRTVKVGKRKLEDLLDEINFFPINIETIHLGETNFNTTEGEIIEYPYFKELILEIEKKRPNVNLSITSSGNSLTEDVIQFLKEHNIALILSIHSLNPEIRAKLTGNTLKRAQIAINSLELCFKYNIKLEIVRLVPMSFVPDEDIYNTLKYLIEHDVERIHIWVASFSKFAQGENVEYLHKECQRISKIINSLNNISQEHFTEIVLLPFPENLTKNIITNVRPNSYAFQIGLRNNDEVISINDILIVNGSHIDEILINNNFINKILIKRNNNFITLKNINGPLIEKDIITNAIIPFNIIEKIYFKVLEDREHSLVICSEASVQNILESLKRMNLFDNYFHHTIAYNQTFGGNICVNGLLTIDDYLLALKKYREENPNSHITKIIISEDSFISGERDVTSRPLQDLRVEGCVDVILI